MLWFAGIASVIAAASIGWIVHLYQLQGREKSLAAEREAAMKHAIDDLRATLAQSTSETERAKDALQASEENGANLAKLLPSADPVSAAAAVLPTLNGLKPSGNRP